MPAYAALSLAGAAVAASALTRRRTSIASRIPAIRMRNHGTAYARGHAMSRSTRR